jgi:hypothetical protein
VPGEREEVRFARAPLRACETPKSSSLTGGSMRYGFGSSSPRDEGSRDIESNPLPLCFLELMPSRVELLFFETLDTGGGGAAAAASGAAAGASSPPSGDCGIVSSTGFRSMLRKLRSVTDSSSGTGDGGTE